MSKNICLKIASQASSSSIKSNSSPNFSFIKATVSSTSSTRSELYGTVFVCGFSFGCNFEFNTQQCHMLHVHYKKHHLFSYKYWSLKFLTEWKTANTYDLQAAAPPHNGSQQYQFQLWSLALLLTLTEFSERGLGSDENRSGLRMNGKERCIGNEHSVFDRIGQEQARKKHLNEDLGFAAYAW